MDPYRETAQRESRATDGLDWSTRSLSEPVSPDQPAAPPGSQRAPRRTGPGALTVIAILGGVCGGFVAGALAGAITGGRSGESEPAAALPVSQSYTIQQTSAISDAAARARGGVVRIESTRRVASGTEQDVGSGVVLDLAGHVVTNAHVVLGTDTLKVILADGTERKAILLGHDYPFTDVAVLQIGPGSLQPLTVGDSEKLVLGETVIAIGNPLAEFDGSVTVGAVSGLQRSRTFDGVAQDGLIQTDAALNNGNSGGALVNLRGEFVGMPTAVLRQNRAGQVVEGIAFALPSARVAEIAARIIAEGGSVPRPSLGAEHVDLTPETLVRLARVQADAGALLTAVAPGGPAERAGIQVGDVVTAVGDHEVNRQTPLLNALMKYEPGATVRVVLNRGGRIIEVDVRLGKRA